VKLQCVCDKREGFWGSVGLAFVGPVLPAPPVLAEFSLPVLSPVESAKVSIKVGDGSICGKCWSR